jgi:hypothetical protein
MSYRGLDRLMSLLRGDEDELDSTTSQMLTYEETTRQMVRDVEEDVRSLRRRLDALIFMVLSAILVEAATRLLGG